MSFNATRLKISLVLCLFGSVWCYASCMVIPTATNMVALPRIVEPARAELLQQKKLQDKRLLCRYSLTAAAAGTACALLYGASAFRRVHEQHKMQQMELVPKGSLVPKPADTGNDDGWMMQGCKTFSKGVVNLSWDMSRFFADAVSMLSAGLIASTVYDKIKEQFAQLYQVETVLWFVHTQTQIDAIFADLKEYATVHDRHSVLLGADRLSQDGSAQVKLFARDLVRVIASQHEAIGGKDFADFQAHLLSEKYGQAADEAATLSNHMTPHAAEFARAAKQDDGSAFDQLKRIQSLQNIEQLCILLRHEIQKVVAFIKIHRHRCPQRIQDLIVSGNQYLQEMETLLNASTNQLENMSKNQQGMFTITYEYERMLKQQIIFLHKYCKIVEIS